MAATTRTEIWKSFAEEALCARAFASWLDSVCLPEFKR
jgi:hypothetical protein